MSKYRSFKSIEINGEVKSLKQWCEIKGVSVRLARARMTDLGWPPAQAVELEPREPDKDDPNWKSQAPVYLTYKRKTKSMPEWHQITKIPLRTLYDRHSRGWSAADILNPERASTRRRKPVPSTTNDVSEKARK